MTTLDPKAWTQLIVSASTTEQAEEYTKQLIYTCADVAGDQRARRNILVLMENGNGSRSVQT